MPPFNKAKMDYLLSTCSTRIGIRQKELNGQVLAMGKDISKKYANGDIEIAQISTETVINTKKMVAALEILNLYIQTLKTRIDSLNYEQAIPMNMRKYIASILFCNGKVDITELPDICVAINKRYGKLLDGIEVDVDPRIRSRLTPCIPTPSDVEETLQEILRKNNVAYQYSEQVNPLVLMESAHTLPSTSSSSVTPSAIPTSSAVSSTDPTFPPLSGTPSFPPAPPAGPSFPPVPPTGPAAPSFPPVPPTAPSFPPSGPSTSSFPPVPPTAPSFPPSGPSAPVPPTAPSFPPVAPAAPAAPSFPPAVPPTAPSFPPAAPAAPAAPTAPSFPPQADLPFGQNASAPVLPPDLQIPSAPQIPSIPNAYVNQGNFSVGSSQQMNDLTDRLNNLK